jgi:peptidyl-dipeptidase A
MLGELLASQLHQYFVRNVLKLESDKDVSYVNRPELGRFLLKKVFEPAAVYHWNQMITNATGEPLSPKYFVAEFVK